MSFQEKNLMNEHGRVNVEALLFLDLASHNTTAVEAALENEEVQKFIKDAKGEDAKKLLFAALASHNTTAVEAVLKNEGVREFIKDAKGEAAKKLLFAALASHNTTANKAVLENKAVREFINDAKEEDAQKLLFAALASRNTAATKAVLKKEAVQKFIQDAKGEKAAKKLLFAALASRNTAAIKAVLKKEAIQEFVRDARVEDAQKLLFDALASHYTKAIEAVLGNEKVREFINDAKEKAAKKLLFAALASQNTTAIKAVLKSENKGVRKFINNAKEKAAKKLLFAAVASQKTQAVEAALENEEIRKFINNAKEKDAKKLLFAALASQNTTAVEAVLENEEVREFIKDAKGEAAQKLLFAALASQKTQAVEAVLENEKVRKFINKAKGEDAQKLLFAALASQNTTAIKEMFNKNNWIKENYLKSVTSSKEIKKLLSYAMNLGGADIKSLFENDAVQKHLEGSHFTDFFDYFIRFGVNSDIDNSLIVLLDKFQEKVIETLVETIEENLRLLFEKKPFRKPPYFICFLQKSLKLREKLRGYIPVLELLDKFMYLWAKNPKNTNKVISQRLQNWTKNIDSGKKAEIDESIKNLEPKKEEISSRKRAPGDACEKPKRKRSRVELSKVADLSFFDVPKVPKVAGLSFFDVPGDGDCLYYAICGGLKIERAKWGDNVTRLREDVACYIERNQENSYIRTVPILEEKTHEEFIINSIRRTGKDQGRWGDDLDISILTQLLEAPIVVIGPDGITRNPFIYDQLRDNPSFFTKDPIFLFYNGYNHYGYFSVNEGYDAWEILNRIRSEYNGPRNLDRGLRAF